MAFHTAILFCYVKVINSKTNVFVAISNCVFQTLQVRFCKAMSGACFATFQKRQSGVISDCGYRDSRARYLVWRDAVCRDIWLWLKRRSGEMQSVDISGCA